MTGESDILVVGAGPTGLTTALSAHDHGARVRIIDRRTDAFRPSRALILHPRTLEVLRPLAVTDALLARADTAPEASLHLGSRVVRARLDGLALPDTAFPHLTLMRQMDVETVLIQALAERGIEVEWGIELTEVSDGPDRARVTLTLSSGSENADFDYVAGCDGPASTVRSHTGVGWEGGPYGEEVVLADVELDADLEDGLAHVVAGRRGALLVFPLGERATWRLLTTRKAGDDGLPYGQPGPAVPSDELQAALDEAGLNARITDLVWSARYRLQRRVATRFSQGRLFLAGDAAHTYSPATGQGMNTGIQDAANLGWKLAFAAAAADHAALLDSYDLERRPIVRRVLRITHVAFWIEASTGVIPSLLRGVVGPLGAPAIPFLIRRRGLVAGAMRRISQLRASYHDSPISAGPRAGHRLPDTTITINGTRTRLHALTARPDIHVLLQRDAEPVERRDFGPHVSVHRLTSVPGTQLMAVRPDGYIGLHGRSGDGDELHQWLERIGATAPASKSGPIR